jgi:hypothetical protein
MLWKGVHRLLCQHYLRLQNPAGDPGRPAGELHGHCDGYETFICNEQIIEPRSGPVPSVRLTVNALRVPGYASPVGISAGQTVCERHGSDVVVPAWPCSPPTRYRLRWRPAIGGGVPFCSHTLQRRSQKRWCMRRIRICQEPFTKKVLQEQTSWTFTTATLPPEALKCLQHGRRRVYVLSPARFQRRYGHSTALQTMYEWGLPQSQLILQNGKKVGHAVCEPMDSRVPDRRRRLPHSEHGSKQDTEAEAEEQENDP